MGPVETKILVSEPFCKGLGRDVPREAESRVVIVVVAPKDCVFSAERVVDAPDQLGLIQFVVGPELGPLKM